MKSYFVAFFTALAAGPSFAQSPTSAPAAASPALSARAPRELINLGHADYQAGRYQEALDAFRAVDSLGLQPASGTAADLLHNEAAAQFKLGNVAAARELWVRSANQKDAGFEARARYNLGNCDYTEAIAAAQPAPSEPNDPAAPESAPAADLGKAIDLLERATNQYRDALRLDPSLTDARANLELAQQLKRDLKQQQQQQSQDQQHQDNKQEGQKDQKQDQKSKDQEKKDKQKQDQQKKDQQKQDQQEQDQQDSSQTEQQQDQQQQQQSQDQKQSGQQGQDEQQESQPEEQQGEDSSDPSKQEPQQGQQGQPKNDQMKPEDAQKEGKEQSKEDAQKQNEQRAQQAEGEAQGEPLNITREQAEKLMQLVRDREKARRKAMLQRQAAQHRPVDRDW